MAMSTREIILLVEKYIGSSSDGYLRHFSYSIHERFYPVHCGIDDIDVPAYRAKGLTTRKAFIQILKDASPRNQAKIIRGVFDMLPPPSEAKDSETKEQISLHEQLIAVASRLESDGQVDTPVILETSETVYEALKDAETLLSTSGPKNAVDRAHTALHGYLKKLCRDRGETLPDDASLTRIFKVLREKFPEFSAVVPYDSEAMRVFG